MIFKKPKSYGGSIAGMHSNIRADKVTVSAVQISDRRCGYYGPFLSTRFLEKAKGLSLLPSDFMAFIFVPISKGPAVETVELLLRSKYDETENRLRHAQIFQLLKFCPRMYNTFDRTIYEQVGGTPMGSPMPGLIAKIVLQRLESLVFQYHRPTF
ncbi:unnamed protein product [Dibothriocephalus latus]|uniref:Reverse transcriptase domain-containing protein n=1 Tax=Dibothriocephalus latus TaxID=60516 RepID=A0A3P7NJY2_DIBLA|nr:unnamed protein product [Dibothriocephalus latus]